VLYTGIGFFENRSYSGVGMTFLKELYLSFCRLLALPVDKDIIVADGGFVPVFMYVEAVGLIFCATQIDGEFLAMAEKDETNFVVVTVGSTVGTKGHGGG